MSLLGDFGTLLVGIGAIFALRQLGQWKHERIAVKRSELGEDLVATTNEIFSRISSIRSPFGFAPPKGQEDDGTYDFTRRLEELSELDDEFIKLRKLRVRAKAWLDDPELQQSIECFFQARGKVFLGLRFRIRVARDASSLSPRKEPTEAEFERLERYESYIYEDHLPDEEGGDPIKKLLEPAMEKIEACAIPLVRLNGK